MGKKSNTNQKNVNPRDTNAYNPEVMQKAMGKNVLINIQQHGTH